MDSLVYDVTAYMRDHPGGLTPLLVHSNGFDASIAFRSMHSHEAYEMRESFCIGILVEKCDVLQGAAVLDASQWLSFRVTDKRNEAGDTIFMRLSKFVLFSFLK